MTESAGTAGVPSPVVTDEARAVPDIPAVPDTPALRDAPDAPAGPRHTVDVPAARASDEDVPVVPAQRRAEEQDGPPAAGPARPDARADAGAPAVAPTSGAAQLLAPQPLSSRASALAAAVGDAVPRVALTLGLAAGRKVDLTVTDTAREPSAALARLGASDWHAVELGIGQIAALVLSDTVTRALADILLGGTGRPGVGEAAPTPLEHRIARRHLATALTALTEPLAGFGVSRVVVREPDHDDPASALGNAEVLSLTLALSVTGQPVDGEFVLALPARAVLGADAGPPPVVTGPAEAALAEVPLTVSVRFPATVLSAFDVQCLEPGDVLRLDAVQPEVIGVVDGVALLRGSLGRRGRHRAVAVHTVREQP